MFDYSKAAIVIILDDFKRWTKIFKIVFSVFTLIYFVYNLIKGNGNIIVNITLLSLYVAYTVFEIVTYNRISKKTKKKIARGYKWSKLSIKAFTLGSMLYGMYVAASSIDGISIILATLTIIIWVLQVLLEVIILVIEPKVKLITAGVLTDAKPYTGPLRFILKKEKDWEISLDEYKKELDILSKRVVITEKPKSKMLGIRFFGRKKKTALIAEPKMAEESLPSAKK